MKALASILIVFASVVMVGCAYMSDKSSTQNSSAHSSYKAEK